MFNMPYKFKTGLQVIKQANNSHGKTEKQLRQRNRGCVPAQIRVSVWMTIHLCSKELEDVSRMVRKISLKNT